MGWRYFIDDSTGTAIRIAVVPPSAADALRSLYRETDALEYAQVRRRSASAAVSSDKQETRHAIP